MEARSGQRGSLNGGSLNGAKMGDTSPVAGNINRAGLRPSLLQKNIRRNVTNTKTTTPPIGARSDTISSRQETIKRNEEARLLASNNVIPEHVRGNNSARHTMNNSRSGAGARYSSDRRNPRRGLAVSSRPYDRSQAGSQYSVGRTKDGTPGQRGRRRSILEKLQPSRLAANENLRRFSALLRQPRTDSISEKSKTGSGGSLGFLGGNNSRASSLRSDISHLTNLSDSIRSLAIDAPETEKTAEQIAKDREMKKIRRQQTMRQVDQKVNVRNAHKAHWLTNQFYDADDEAAYQRYCAGFIVEAKLVVKLFFIMNILQVVYEVFTDFTGDLSVEGGKLLKENDVRFWVHMIYLPFAIPFFLIPTERWYLFWKKQWKLVFILITSLIVNGLVLRLAFLANEAVIQAEDRFAICGNTDIQDAVSWSERQQVLVVLLACGLMVFVAQVVLLITRSDLKYIISFTVLSLAVCTSAIYMLDFEMHNQGLLSLIAILAAGLYLCRILDKSGRDLYVNMRKQGEENVDLGDAMMILSHDGFNEQEKEAVSEVLDDGGQLLVAKIPFSDLKLERLIGKGAYGEVIRGYYHGTKVVMKRMRREDINSKNLELFADEVKLMVNLRHPNIVQFIGGTWDSYSNIGFILEFCERGDLYSVLHDRKLPDLTWEDAGNKMAIAAARGMAYLHAQDSPVIHRDLKSVNILVTATFGCKVADFGMSRVQTSKGAALDGSPSVSKAVVGTPLWLAPEVIREQPHTTASDVFSFGIVLTEIFTRQDPYYKQLKTSSAREIMVRVERDMLRPSIGGQAPQQLKLLIKDCLEDEPRKRPNMVDVLNRLYAMESSLNESMRAMMRRTDNQEMWSKLVRQLPFFEGANQQFRDFFLSSILLKEYLPDTVIVQQGEVADAVYFCKLGTLDVLVGNTRVYTLKEGSFFGEQAFKTSSEGDNGTPRRPQSGQIFKQVTSYRTATVKCTTRCQLLMLHQNEFFRILQDFPAFGNRLQSKRDYIFDGALKDADVMLTKNGDVLVNSAQKGGGVFRPTNSDKPSTSQSGQQAQPHPSSTSPSSQSRQGKIGGSGGSGGGMGASDSDTEIFVHTNSDNDTVSSEDLQPPRTSAVPAGVQQLRMQGVQQGHLATASAATEQNRPNLPPLTALLGSTSAPARSNADAADAVPVPGTPKGRPKRNPNPSKVEPVPMQVEQ